MGRQAAFMLLQRIRDKTRPIETYNVDLELVVRESTAPYRNGPQQGQHMKEGKKEKT
jgi:hypothetical protein